jgi:hypothetical protein
MAAPQPVRQAPPIQIELWDKNMGWVGPLGTPLSVSATKRRNAPGDCTFTIPALVEHPRTHLLVPHPRLDALHTARPRCSLINTGLRRCQVEEPHP